MRTARKTVSAVAGLAALVALSFAAVAYACTSLATLNTSAPAGNPGSNVTVTGSGFASAQGAAAAPSSGHAGATAAPVILHWGGVDGPVLGQTAADRAGNITAQIAIPQNATPGPNVIVATQQNARGQHVSGTPARAPFQVNGPNGQAVTPQQPAADPSRVPTSGGSNATGIAIGAIGLMLFAGGFVTYLVARRPSRGAGARIGRS
jgi:hypothetical protein